MNKVLWIVQILLAVAFLGAGATKLSLPITDLVAQGMTFADQIPEWMVRLAGLSEVLGAIGLVVPGATKIKPILTPVAAAALAVVMALAIVTHIWLAEWPALVGPLVLGSLASFVAWGRFKKVPLGESGQLVTAS